MMSEQVQFVVELSINDLEAFKRVATACIESVQATEPTTLAYVWNISEDGARCVILEWYANASVIPAHIELVGPILAGLGGAAEITRFQVLGKLTEEARLALHAAGAATVGFWAGFSRA